jgi:hypothetical protein
MYLYISEAKVRQLADDSPALLGGITAKLGVNLAGVLEGSIERKSHEGLVKDLDRVIKKLRKHNVIVSFDEVTGTALRATCLLKG